MSKFGRRGPRKGKGEAMPTAKPAAPERAQRQKAPAPLAAPAPAAPQRAWKPRPEPEPYRPRQLGPRDVLVLSGPTYDKLRKEVQMHKAYPRRAHYASSLVHGLCRMDGKDESGAMLGEGGHNVRVRVAEVWERCGGVIIEHDGVVKLAAVKE